MMPPEVLIHECQPRGQRLSEAVRRVINVTP
jgi:hypothetical protein